MGGAEAAFVGLAEALARRGAIASSPPIMRRAARTITGVAWRRLDGFAPDRAISHREPWGAIAAGGSRRRGEPSSGFTIQPAIS